MADRPNVLVIMTDQQRYDTIGALGNALIQTPALDRLVRGGTSFTSAYCASPVCVASRCSFVLGEYPHMTGCTANSPMPLERKSMMQYLSEEGYQTHGVGKMHFSPKMETLWGFDSRDMSEGSGQSGDFRDFLNDNGFDHVMMPNGERSEYYYIPQPSQLPERLHNTTWTGDRTLDFLDRRDKDRPFFLWMSFFKPHPPFEAPIPWNRLYRQVEMEPPEVPPDNAHLLCYWNHFQNRYKYRDQGNDMNLIRAMRAMYYGIISQLDYQIGRVLDQLETEGVLDETLVLFTSDHGEFLGDYNCYGKRSHLDPAARVPFLVHYPKRFAANKQCDILESLVDALPTVFGAVGLDTESQHVGVDLAKIASGDRDRDEVMGQLSEEDKGLYTLITRDFKYIYSAADRKEWLFKRLPGQIEKRSLAGHAAYRSVLESLRERLIQRFRDDGYEAPLDGDGWRDFPQPVIPDAPDAGQLFQDGPSVVDLFPAGYRPCVDTRGASR